MRVGEEGMRALGFLVSSWWADRSSSRIGAFWRRELFYLGVIREERTVGWYSVDVGGVSSRIPSYLILSATTLHAAVVLLGGGGREFEEIANYMVEQGNADECLPIKLST